MLSNGDVFAGYIIERQLGRGGMGSVYLAKHPRLPRLTALKLLNREMVFDKEVRARFEREADLVAQLDHHNIVTVYDRGLEDGQLWISMQYVDGVDASGVTPQTLPPERAVQIVAETGDALDYAHRNEVLHRDVKPANILLARSTGGKGERVYLTDFGIARLRDDHGQNLTQTGTFTATLAYASPEQLTGSPLDGSSDQYSLACTLFWLLTGSGPFSATNPAAVIQGHLQQPPPPLSGLRPGLPHSLDLVMAKAMAKRPEDRFPSCADFAAAARRALTAPSAPAMPLVNPRTAPPQPVMGASPTIAQPAGGFMNGAPTQTSGGHMQPAGGSMQTGGPRPNISGSAPTVTPNQYSAQVNTATPPPQQLYNSGARPTNQYTGPPTYNYTNQSGNYANQSGNYANQSGNHANPAGPPPNMRPPMGPPHAQPPKKSNTGLIIGAIIGVVVLAIAAVVVLVALSGGSNKAGGTTTTAKAPTTSAYASTPAHASTSAAPASSGSSSGTPADVAGISAQFSHLVPATATGDTGYNGASCWVADPKSPPDKSDGEPDFGDWAAQWRCFGGGNNDDPFYRIYAYSSADKVKSVVSGLKPDKTSSDASGGKTYTNYEFTGSRPRMVTVFTGDNNRTQYLMYTDGVAGSMDALLTWWRSAPLN
ncbi:protein kinase domain-containing protein [Nocardia sp. NBC_01327]|uniref:protein kinase domain-containing protein n=1 Tax=Nocardia sp. NBC_01327 TaxID=2903593 RepID=UPI002E1529C2|nr:protein kinase [Nocardia sp. NBC_01327]